MNGRVDGCIYGWMDGCIYGWLDGQIHWWMNWYMNNMADEYTDEPIYEWINIGMDAQKGRCMDRYIYKS